MLKGVLPRLLLMSDDLLRAFLWDALAFEALLSVLQQAINAVLAWRDRSAACTSTRRSLASKHSLKRLIHSISRRLSLLRRPAPDLFPRLIYAGAVKRLLILKLPPYPVGVPCEYVTSYAHGATAWQAQPRQ
jgi:hypothetical protein